jgi:hypothetical protein
MIMTSPSFSYSEVLLVSHPHALPQGERAEQTAKCSLLHMWGQENVGETAKVQVWLVLGVSLDVQLGPKAKALPGMSRWPLPTSRMFSVNSLSFGEAV